MTRLDPEPAKHQITIELDGSVIGIGVNHQLVGPNSAFPCAADKGGMHV
jgi:hypothetical protein